MPSCIMYFAPLPSAREVDDSEDESQQNMVWFFVGIVIRELTSALLVQFASLTSPRVGNSRVVQ